MTETAFFLPCRWNHAFKNQINSLQVQAKEKQVSTDCVVRFGQIHRYVTLAPRTQELKFLSQILAKVQGCCICSVFVWAHPCLWVYAKEN